MDVQYTSLLKYEYTYLSITALREGKSLLSLRFKKGTKSKKVEEHVKAFGNFHLVNVFLCTHQNECF